MQQETKRAHPYLVSTPNLTYKKNNFHLESLYVASLTMTKFETINCLIHYPHIDRDISCVADSEKTEEENKRNIVEEIEEKNERLNSTV